MNYLYCLSNYFTGFFSPPPPDTSSPENEQQTTHDLCVMLGSLNTKKAELQAIEIPGHLLEPIDELLNTLFLISNRENPTERCREWSLVKEKCTFIVDIWTPRFIALNALLATQQNPLSRQIRGKVCTDWSALIHSESPSQEIASFERLLSLADEIANIPESLQKNWHNIPEIRFNQIVTALTATESPPEEPLKLCKALLAIHSSSQEIFSTKKRERKEQFLEKATSLLLSSFVEKRDLFLLTPYCTIVQSAESLFRKLETCADASHEAPIGLDLKYETLLTSFLQEENWCQSLFQKYERRIATLERLSAVRAGLKALSNEFSSNSTFESSISTAIAGIYRTLRNWNPNHDLTEWQKIDAAASSFCENYSSLAKRSVSTKQLPLFQFILTTFSEQLANLTSDHSEANEEEEPADMPADGSDSASAPDDAIESEENDPEEATEPEELSELEEEEDNALSSIRANQSAENSDPWMLASTALNENLKNFDELLLLKEQLMNLLQGSIEQLPMINSRISNKVIPLLEQVTTMLNSEQLPTIETMRKLRTDCAEQLAKLLSWKAFLPETTAQNLPLQGEAAGLNNLLETTRCTNAQKANAHQQLDPLHFQREQSLWIHSPISCGLFTAENRNQTIDLLKELSNHFIDPVIVESFAQLRTNNVHVAAQEKVLMENLLDLISELQELQASINRRAALCSLEQHTQSLFTLGGLFQAFSDDDTARYQALQQNIQRSYEELLTIRHRGANTLLSQLSSIRTAIENSPSIPQAAKQRIFHHWINLHAQQKCLKEEIFSALNQLSRAQQAQTPFWSNSLKLTTLYFRFLINPKRTTEELYQLVLSVEGYAQQHPSAASRQFLRNIISLFHQVCGSFFVKRWAHEMVQNLLINDHFDTVEAMTTERIEEADLPEELREIYQLCSDGRTLLQALQGGHEGSSAFATPICTLIGAIPGCYGLAQAIATGIGFIERRNLQEGFDHLQAILSQEQKIQLIMRLQGLQRRFETIEELIAERDRVRTMASAIDKLLHPDHSIFRFFWNQVKSELSTLWLSLTLVSGGAKERAVRIAQIALPILLFAIGIASFIVAMAAAWPLTLSLNTALMVGGLCIALLGEGYSLFALYRKLGSWINELFPQTLENIENYKHNNRQARNQRTIAAYVEGQVQETLQERNLSPTDPTIASIREQYFAFATAYISGTHTNQINLAQLARDHNLSHKTIEAATRSLPRLLTPQKKSPQ